MIVIVRAAGPVPVVFPEAWTVAVMGRVPGAPAERVVVTATVKASAGETVSAAVTVVLAVYEAGRVPEAAVVPPAAETRQAPGTPWL